MISVLFSTLSYISISTTLPWPLCPFHPVQSLLCLGSSPAPPYSVPALVLRNIYHKFHDQDFCHGGSRPQWQFVFSSVSSSIFLIKASYFFGLTESMCSVLLALSFNFALLLSLHLSLHRNLLISSKKNWQNPDMLWQPLAKHYLLDTYQIVNKEFSHWEFKCFHYGVSEKLRHSPCFRISRLTARA